MKKSSFSNSLDIFIEEPEANLFPIDQKNMAYFYLRLENVVISQM